MLFLLRSYDFWNESYVVHGLRFSGFASKSSLGCGILGRNPV